MKVDDKLLKKSISAAINFSVIKRDGYKDKVRKFDESIDFIINLKVIPPGLFIRCYNKSC